MLPHACCSAEDPTEKKLWLFFFFICIFWSLMLWWCQLQLIKGCRLPENFVRKCHHRGMKCYDRTHQIILHSDVCLRGCDNTNYVFNSIILIYIYVCFNQSSIISSQILISLVLIYTFMSEALCNQMSPTKQM